MFELGSLLGLSLSWTSYLLFALWELESLLGPDF